MARRRYSRSSYRPRRSYTSRSGRGPSRRRSSSRAGQTLRIVMQQPGMSQGMRPRPPFGTFQPSALFNPFMNPYMGQGAPWEAQGGPGIPGARMVINPVPAPPQEGQGPIPQQPDPNAPRR